MTDILKIIETTKNNFLTDCKSITDLSHLNQIEFTYLKSAIKTLYSHLKSVDDPQYKKQAGKQIHEFKAFLEEKIQELKSNHKLNNLNDLLSANHYDTSIVKQNISRGTIHPLNNLYKNIENILVNMGFSVVQGPEIELDKNNFEKLNMPFHHPARDMQDTFYIQGRTDALLRSHTSSVQIRVMEKIKPPIRIISPGTVYRVDDIGPQHTPMFYQIEGLVVDRKVSFSDLKGVLTTLIQTIFGSSTKLRFRPSYYPYTEPSAAVDMSCIICNQAGCRTCGNSGWITMLGAGMVHPNVFDAVGYDSTKYSGFAFGMGLNRLALIYYGLAEIRTLYENDILLYGQL